MALTALLAPLVGSIIDEVADLIPNSNDRAKAKEKAQSQMLEIVGEAMKGQLDINKQEAAHHSIFVAGWRPFIGWVCGFGIAWQFIITPLISWAMLFYMAAHPEAVIPAAPELDMTELFGLVFAMLGMGGLRTYEKLNGVARKS